MRATTVVCFGCLLFSIASSAGATVGPDGGRSTQLSYFLAVITPQGNVRLEWGTLSEVNNYGFELQKSPTTFVSYQTIPNSFVPGNGTTIVPHDYVYTDSTASPGTWYYRLKQIDLSSEVHYSDSVLVTLYSQFSVSPGGISFSGVVVGLSKNDSATVKNTGNSRLTIDSVKSDNGEFVALPGSSVIIPSDSQRFYVTFSPTIGGPASGSIVFFHDGSTSPDSVSVDGIGLAAVFGVTPSSLNFSDVPVNQSKIDSVEVSNTGTLTLVIDSVSSNASEFSVLPGSASVPPLATEKFFVTFAPASAGLKNGSIVFHSNGPTSPDTLVVSGHGVAPGFLLSQTAVSFGNVEKYTAKEDSVFITNPGTASLEIDSIRTYGGEFNAVPYGPLAIAPSLSQKLTATFNPTVTGPQAGSVVIYSNAETSPDTLAVSGTGVQSVFSVLPLSIVFGTVQVGYSAVETLTVVNTGSFDLEIDSVRSYGAGFGVSPDGASVIAPLDSLIYAVAFSPTAGGAYAGGIVFFSNAESTPDTAEVSGTAQFVAAAAAFAGWNIVSLPVTVPDRRRSAVFPTSSSGAYAYGPSGYSARDTLEYGEGYWLKFPSLQTVQIAGDERDEDTVSLTQGWNVIGSISYPVPVNSITQVPSGLVVSPYFGYTGTGYATTDTIHTMKGYWVKANESGFLILVRP